MEKWAGGTLCWSCSRVATCSKVSRHVDACEFFIRSYVSNKEVADALGVSERTVYRLYKVMPNKVIKAIKLNENERIIIETDRYGKKTFFRKDNGI